MTVSSSFLVRRAVMADADLLADVGARTFRDAYAVNNDPELLERHIAQAFTPQRLAGELADPRSTFLLGYDTAWSRDRPVGYVRLVNGPANACVAGRRPLELARIYVERSLMGAGYGAALLRAALDTARRGGFETVWLGVWERNDRARRFYERWGFRAVGSQNFAFGGELQTDIVMERPAYRPEDEGTYR